jgi:hypothetical protein
MLPAANSRRCGAAGRCDHVAAGKSARAAQPTRTRFRWMHTRLANILPALGGVERRFNLVDERTRQKGRLPRHCDASPGPARSGEPSMRRGHSIDALARIGQPRADAAAEI